MSTIVMRVDLECDRCYKKIRKVLCKLQDRENIKLISYDEKSNMVTVSGSFDAEEVSDRLCSSAGKVITDIQVARGNQMMMPGVGAGNGKAPPKHPGKENHGGQQGHGLGHGVQQGPGLGHGGGQQGHGKGGGQQGHGKGGGQQGHGKGGGQLGHGQGGGGGGKPDKTKHVKFDFDTDDEEFDQHGKGHGNDHGKGHGQGHGHAEKPRVFTTTAAMSRNEAPRPQQPASMAAMAPMRMPTPGPSMMMMPTTGPSMTMMPQALSTPSIWPPPPPAAAPAYGYGAPAYGYGGGPPAGGYYGGPVYDHAGYGAYGMNPYCQPQQYYEEEPSAGCSVM